MTIGYDLEEKNSFEAHDENPNSPAVNEKSPNKLTFTKKLLFVLILAVIISSAIYYMYFMEAGEPEPVIFNDASCHDCHEQVITTFNSTSESHKDENCTNCHIEHYSLPNCLDCHDDALIPHPIIDPFNDCQSCHVEGGHDPGKVNFSALSGVLVSSDLCSGQSCHESDVFAQLDNNVSIHAGSMFNNNCLACHMDHELNFSCFTCHDESTEPEHDILPPYDDCFDCHNDTHNAMNITFPGSKSNIITSLFCDNCHDPQLLLIPDTPKYSSLECQSCHENHLDASNCQSCHSVDGIANRSGHMIAAPFDDCMQCHTNAHDSMNITLSNFNSTVLNHEFCDICHDEISGTFTENNPEHVLMSCQGCHEDHVSEEIDCADCHTTEGTANPPPHTITTPFDACASCHDTPHDILSVGQFGVPFTNNDFCAPCHSEAPNDEYTKFMGYGVKHEENEKCTDSCHTDHSIDKSCTSTDCHAGATYPAMHLTYSSEGCQSCHDSAHNPINSAPAPGSSLSQRDYMISYYTFSNRELIDSFEWNLRGNHELGSICINCHPSAEESNYPVTAIPPMNLTGTNCAEGCHLWINPITTGDPFQLINSSSSKHTTEIFNNASRGGCTGYCHQENPNSPVLNGSGHGTITSCLDLNCHAKEFELEGSVHNAHEVGLIDTGLGCFSVCHTGDTDHNNCKECHELNAETGEVLTSMRPIAGGCYDCHKSGHDPSLNTGNPCESCH